MNGDIPGTFVRIMDQSGRVRDGPETTSWMCPRGSYKRNCTYVGKRWAGGRIRVIEAGPLIHVYYGVRTRAWPIKE